MGTMGIETTRAGALRWGAGILLATTMNAAAADVVTDWDLHVINTGGPQIQRTLAMVHLAMFDAVNAIEGGYTPYLILPAPPPAASAEAAAASAAHGVLVRLFPAQATALDTALAASLGAVPDGAAEDDGVAFGDMVAAAMVAARQNDNILAPGPLYVPGANPGDYQLTTSTPPQPVNTNAPNWQPFALATTDQFRPQAPPRLTSRRYAEDLNETQRLGGAGSAERTEEQSLIARWHTEQAQFQFTRIARNLAETDGLGLLERARLFAHLTMALADATMAVFDAKYAYAFWRPVTAIQKADTDGNDLTVPDPTWGPYLPTPPHPEYPAAHGSVQGAGARVLERYYGRDQGFDTTAPAAPGVIRHYDSFEAFAEEGAAARIYGGMHYRHSLDIGSRQGKQVGNWVLENFLVPVD